MSDCSTSNIEMRPHGSQPDRTAAAGAVLEQISRGRAVSGVHLLSSYRDAQRERLEALTHREAGTPMPELRRGGHLPEYVIRHTPHMHVTQ